MHAIQRDSGILRGRLAIGGLAVRFRAGWEAGSFAVNGRNPADCRRGLPFGGSRLQMVFLFILPGRHHSARSSLRRRGKDQGGGSGPPAQPLRLALEVPAVRFEKSGLPHALQGQGNLAEPFVGGGQGGESRGVLRIEPQRPVEGVAHLLEVFPGLVAAGEQEEAGGIVGKALATFLAKRKCSGDPPTPEIFVGEPGEQRNPGVFAQGLFEFRNPEQQGEPSFQRVEAATRGRFRTCILPPYVRPFQAVPSVFRIRFNRGAGPGTSQRHRGPLGNADLFQRQDTRRRT